MEETKVENCSPFLSEQRVINIKENHWVIWYTYLGIVKSFVTTHNTIHLSLNAIQMV